ncbi:MAG: hypothetical protein IJ190_13015 [Prevotella sp.]|nr:hypothetical protein [Prevotella sp.]
MKSGGLAFASDFVDDCREEALHFREEPPHGRIPYILPLKTVLSTRL